MRLLSNQIYDFEKFATRYNFFVEYIGINFLHKISSVKVYYGIKRHSDTLYAKEVLYPHIGNMLTNQCIKYLLSNDNSSLLDISFKKTNSCADNRCTIKVQTSYDDVISIKEFISKIGFEFSIPSIDCTRQYIHNHYPSNIEPLYVIGFNSVNQRTTVLKTYYRFSCEEIISNYSDYNSHPDQQDLFLHIYHLCEVLDSQNELFKVFTILSNFYFFIDFLGIDFDLQGCKLYKIYFKKSNQSSIDEAIEAITNLSMNECNVQQLNNELSNINHFRYEVDGIGVAFNSSAILRFQIYLGGCKYEID